jgi:hypothetical protein
LPNCGNEVPLEDSLHTTRHLSPLPRVQLIDSEEVLLLLSAKLLAGTVGACAFSLLVADKRPNEMKPISRKFFIVFIVLLGVLGSIFKAMQYYKKKS